MQSHFEPRIRKDGENIPDFEKVVGKLGVPFFVKPANMGSSVGVSKVQTTGEYKEAIAEAFDFDLKVIVEEFVEGREIECSVLGNSQPIAPDHHSAPLHGEASRAR